MFYYYRFVEKPVVVNVFDEEGDMLPNKVRVMWGRMENFKCVDYFQVKLHKDWTAGKKSLTLPYLF